ncbi:MAG: hypothetical protein Ct9H90mP16_14560 [Candidatus Poseidoniales archaeon]|nr:MAG: hypothetical protein Ct9H90mP16_14560 [Candidatus Poseidoniales archaeon]
MTGESLTPEQAHELLELMSNGDVLTKAWTQVQPYSGRFCIANWSTSSGRGPHLTCDDLAKENEDKDQLAWALLTKARITSDGEALAEADEWVAMSEDDWLRSAYNNQCGIHALESMIFRLPKLHLHRVWPSKKCWKI